MHAAVRQDRWSMDAQKVPQGMGSGFFWDDKGHIVTNYHVIRGAADIKVALIDQSVWSAKVSCLHVSTHVTNLVCCLLV